MSVDTATPAGSAGSVGDRYRLLECVAGDPDGPAVAWRAWDNLLARPVTLTVVRPGGPAAAGFLAHAHAVSTVVHPALARVYDAVDEEDRAYVVSEWVTGTPLTALLREGALDPDVAASTVGRIAEGITAAHAAGVAFGGVHPDHVVVTPGGTVTLAQVVGDSRATTGDDIRGLGALLYAALTAHWPLPATGGAAALRPASTNGRQLVTPRQVRAGVPEELSTLAMHALDPAGPHGVHSAAAMSAVLSARGGSQEDLFAFGPDDQDQMPEPRRRPRWLALAVPVSAGLIALALVGWMIGAALRFPSSGNNSAHTTSPTSTVTTGGKSSPAATTSLKALLPRSAALYDPSPRSDHAENAGIALSYDQNPATSWPTDSYRLQGTSTFGNLKQGLGIAYDMGQAVSLRQVKIITDRPHTSVQILAGSSPNATDPASYTVAGQLPTPSSHAASIICAAAPPRSQVIESEASAARGPSSGRTGKRTSLDSVHTTSIRASCPSTSESSCSSSRSTRRSPCRS